MLKLNGFYNMDCMDGMARIPDKYFELAIVDPPYGLNIYAKGTMGGGVLAKQSKFKPTKWDKSIPDNQYFEELKRVSKNQIIWGGNYYNLEPTPCYIVWDKQNGKNNFADCELAWTSFKTAVRKFEFKWQGMLQGDMKNKETKIHPTQKPVKLYEWLLLNYAKAGDKILDTHVGSASSLIACNNLGFEYMGFELDKDYFEAATKRLESVKAQINIY